MVDDGKAEEAKPTPAGTVEKKVEVQPVAPSSTQVGKDEIKIVTTAPGTFGPGGIAKVGTKAVVPFSKFSEQWMKPATAPDVRKLEKWQKEQAGG